MISQSGRSPHPLRRGRETRSVHAIATTSPENHRPLRTCESESNRFLAHALTDAYDAMGKTTSQALGIDEKPALDAPGGLEAQTVQGVEPARDTIQPCCEAS